MNWFDLVVSFLITWSVGLSPALLARYVVIRGPIKPTSANWIAGLSCVVFFFAFRVVIASLGGDDPGPGYVWVFVFFVSRWIMLRGYHEELLRKIEARLTGDGLSDAERLKLEAAKARFQDKGKKP